MAYAIGGSRPVRQATGMRGQFQWQPSKWARKLGMAPAWQLGLTRTHLIISVAGVEREIPLRSVRRVADRHGLVWSSCQIEWQPEEDDTTETLVLKGLSKGQAEDLATVVPREVGKRLAGDLDGVMPEVKAWVTTAHRVIERDRWIRQSEIAGLRQQRDELPIPRAGMTLRQVHDHPLTGKPSLLTGQVMDEAFSVNLEETAARHNAEFLERQLQTYQTFFDTVESKPLTREQAEAAICFDDRVRLIAGAGSGKTSTMVARAGYACLSGIAAPAEVLMLAFNAEAASELKERVNGRLAHWVPAADQVTCSTFHAFGLRVIGEATGRKPSVPGWIERGQDLQAISRIIMDLAGADPGFKAQWELFSAVFGRDIGKFAKQRPQVALQTGPNVIRTLRGEIVKSLEEKALADWLAFHGVRYDYERRYPVDTADAHHRQYCPDFYYPDIDLYHEHFALDQYGRPPPHFEGYAEGVEWKRELHQRHQTQLIETTSHTLRTGEAFVALKQALEDRGLTLNPSAANLGPGAPVLTVKAMAKTLRTFLSHFKANQSSLEEIRERAKEASTFPVRAQLFLRVFEAVLNEWNLQLAEEECVDFDDMLHQAADLIESGAWVSPFKVVAVDEWQDTSAARARIVNALSGAHRPSFEAVAVDEWQDTSSTQNAFALSLSATRHSPTVVLVDHEPQDPSAARPHINHALPEPGVSVAVIGDDWQAINRFSGADIRFMTQFDKLVGPASTRFLTETFRCPQHLNDVAASFVCRNPAQLSKQVRSHNTMEGRSTRLLLHKRGEQGAVLESQLERLGEQARREGCQYRVLLLGRYHYNRPENLASLQRVGGGSLSLRYMTVHKAKGLEADYVFLLDLHDGQYGFPCQVEDDPLLDLVMPDPDPYPHAEERRLLYVALTRARRRVVVLAEATWVSPFMIELVEHGAGQLVLAPEQKAVTTCPACGEGLLIPRQGRYGEFLGCTRYPDCRHTNESTPD